MRDQTALPQGLKDAINNGTYSYSPGNHRALTLLSNAVSHLHSCSQRCAHALCHQLHMCLTAGHQVSPEEDAASEGPPSVASPWSTPGASIPPTPPSSLNSA